MRMCRQWLLVSWICMIIFCVGLAKRDGVNELGATEVRRIIVTRSAPQVLHNGMSSFADVAAYNFSGFHGRAISRHETGAVTSGAVISASTPPTRKHGETEPHAGEDKQNVDFSCFPAGDHGNEEKKKCCDTSKGKRGDESCWSDVFTYKMCCSDDGGKKQHDFLDKHLHRLVAALKQSSESEQPTCNIPSDQFDERTADPTLIGDCKLHYCMVEACDLEEGDCTDCPESVLHTTRRKRDMISKVQHCYQRIPQIFLWQSFIIPASIWLAHILVAPFMQLFYNNCYVVGSKFHHFVVTYIGTQDLPPHKSSMLGTLLALEAISSAIYVILFTALNTYSFPGWPWEISQSAPAHAKLLAWGRFYMNFIMLTVFYVEWLIAGFDIRHLFTFSAIFDLFTVHNYYWRCAKYKKMHPSRRISWDRDLDLLALARPKLNLLFLRAYRCTWTVSELAAIGSFDAMDDVTQQLIKSVCRFFTLVVISAGAVVVGTWLGYDLERSGTVEHSFEDFGECRADTRIRSLLICHPFFTAVYWIFTTITTVGYGDFAPNDTLTRTLIIIIILGGVTFFGVESGIILEAIDVSVKGKGNYVKPLGFSRTEHIIVTGSAVEAASKESLIPFLSQLLGRCWLESGRKHPEVVLLGNVEHDQACSCWDSLPMKMQSKVKFIEGSPISKADLERVCLQEATFVYVLPNFSTADELGEDKISIQAALSIKRVLGSADVRLRVLLFLPRSLDLARTCALPRSWLVCFHALKSSLLAQSLVVQGWSTLMCALMSQASLDLDEDEYLKKCGVPTEYKHCMSQTTWAVNIHPRHSDKTFKEIGLEIYLTSGHLLIGAGTDESGKGLFPRDEKLPGGSRGFLVGKDDPLGVPSLRDYLSDVPMISEARRTTGFWKPQLAQRQLSMDERRSGRSTLVDEPTSPELMAKMREKADRFRQEGNFALLIASTSPDDDMFMIKCRIQEFIFSFQDSMHDRLEDQFRLVVLSPNVLPKSLVSIADSANYPVAFIVGDALKKDVLEGAGACECTAIVTFGCRPTSENPVHDQGTFFLLQVLRGVNMKLTCLVLVEVDSGTIGSHMLEDIRVVRIREDDEQPDALPPEPAKCDDDFNLWTSAGCAFMPRMLMSLMACSYYNPGILQVFESFTYRMSKSNLKPVQAAMPKPFHGQPYQAIVRSGLEGKLGPSPVLVLGLLRRTPIACAALMHPDPALVVQDDDLVTVLADADWTAWSQNEGLRCIAGVPVEVMTSTNTKYSLDNDE